MSCVGEIRIFGGNFAPPDWAICNGQVWQIAENRALFDRIGTTYGGDGVTTFALPDFGRDVLVGAGTGFPFPGAGIAPLAVDPSPAPLTCLIALADDGLPTPFVGEIRLFPFLFAPDLWMPCEGQLLPMEQYSLLYSVIGSAYGGDGATTFALPDLRGTVAQSPASTEDPPIGYLVMNFCIAWDGVWLGGDDAAVATNDADACDTESY